MQSFPASQDDYWDYFLHGCRFFAFLLLHEGVPPADALSGGGSTLQMWGGAR